MEFEYTQKHQKHCFSLNKNGTLSFGEFFFILCLFVVFGFLFVFAFLVVFCVFFWGEGAFSRIYVFFGFPNFFNQEWQERQIASPS